MISTGQLNLNCAVISSLPRHGLRELNKVGHHQPLYTGIPMVQSMCPACPKPLQHGQVEAVTLTCLSTINCHHLSRVSLQPVPVCRVSLRPVPVCSAWLLASLTVSTLRPSSICPLNLHQTPLPVSTHRHSMCLSYQHHLPLRVMSRGRLTTIS